ncbi:MAG: FAD-binding oxidoreductase [Ignavibacteria bacterium]|jgi:glycine/D-amino acid oxidase-like deaminating enzyme|nr:FAD-binding oxidoreductase [Ignavibacteria bacterium]MCU7502675.1 FAD-binding oxidoreductase [Ignavibacteria bacterium]MCU7515122.1 FAD-binding oxidoreductase [Ignavibacteria bacterium]
MGKTSLVIGGGFFGMYIANHLARKGSQVYLVEKENQFMSRASFNNQARVHNGYHYPRSILTAMRSRISFPRFVAEFPGCIVSDFRKYYLIGKALGKISARQFLEFCERIGAPCEPAPRQIRALVNPALIEDCFSVVEYAFNAVKLRDLMKERLDSLKVNCVLGTSVESISSEGGEGLKVTLLDKESLESRSLKADEVFNCTYSQINYVNRNSGLEMVPLKHELTEICLVDVPEELKSVGITVMCGPFFSIMPFPPTVLHSFSHVRYTPHLEWQDVPGMDYGFRDQNLSIHSSAWHHMQKDAERYMPVLSECRYQESLWEIKTVLPRSESNDSRPILFLPDHGLKGYHCIMGGKIDNVYDVIEAVGNNNLLS